MGFATTVPIHQSHGWLDVPSWNPQNHSSHRTGPGEEKRPFTFFQGMFLHEFSRRHSPNSLFRVSQRWLLYCCVAMPSHRSCSSLSLKPGPLFVVRLLSSSVLYGSAFLDLHNSLQRTFQTGAARIFSPSQTHWTLSSSV